MLYRSKHMSCYCLLVGGLLFSLGFNFIQYYRIQKLESYTVQNWLSVPEYEIIKTEIERLENVKYPKNN